MAKPSIRLLVLFGVVVLAVAALTRPNSADATTNHAAMLDQIDDLRTETWRWQRLTMAPRTPTNYSERETSSLSYRTWVRGLWRARAAAAERRAMTPPRRAQWLCIHRHERHPGQGWRTRTGNGYYGGLQMDLDFQRAVRRRPAAAEGHRGPLVADRADLGGRAGLSQRPRLPPLAEHRPLLRAHLAAASTGKPVLAQGQELRRMAKPCRRQDDP